jgi:aromatic-L-amino-acid/L-tryptophan decarboxylase
MKDSLSYDEPDPAETGIELSRHFRGLRIWLPLQLHGLAPFKAALEEKLLLCRYFKREMDAAGFETGPEPDLSVTIFRLRGDGQNLMTGQLLDGLHKNGRVYFSSTVIKGKVWIRCAIVNFRTHLKEVNEALQMIKSVAGKIRND